MDYDDDDALPHENYQPLDDDDEQPAKRVKPSKHSSDEDEHVNQKRGYTSKEQDMIAEWLKNNQPKTDDSTSK